MTYFKYYATSLLEGLWKIVKLISQESQLNPYRLGLIIRWHNWTDDFSEIWHLISRYIKLLEVIRS
jgi:hypothetical protein